MPKLDEQIIKGQGRYRKGRKRFLDKVPLRQVTPTGLITHFNQMFRKHDFGEPPLLTQKTAHMLKGFVRMALKQDKESEWLFKLVTDVVERWEDLRGYEFVTQNGKAWIIGPRPSLKDLVTCSGSMISHIEDIHRIENLGIGEEIREFATPVKAFHLQKVALPVRQRFSSGPSPEEIDADFRRMQDDE